MPRLRSPGLGSATWKPERSQLQLKPRQLQGGQQEEPLVGFVDSVSHPGGPGVGLIPNGDTVYGLHPPVT